MKNRKFKAILAVLLVAVLAFGSIAFADNISGMPTVVVDAQKLNDTDKASAITFENAEKFVDADGNEYYDLFPEMKNMMPGDSVTQPIKVKVKNAGGNMVKVYLNAQANSDFASHEGQPFNEDYALIKDLVTVTFEDENFTGSLDKIPAADSGSGEVNGDTAPDGEDAAEKGIFLGNYDGSEKSTILTATFALPLEAGDEYQGLLAELGWVFTAELHESPGGGGSVIPEPVIPTPPMLEAEDHFAYIIGYPDGSVKPENNISREEVATIFFRLLTDEARMEVWSQTNDFSDVKTSRWSNNAISTMTNAGIVNGYPNGTFGPGKPITRAEFAAIAARFDTQPYEGGTDKFSDISGHWAADYINRAAERGWINGYEDGTFKPDQYITRAEAMTLVNRVLNRRTHAEDMLDDMVKWPDNATWAWYYEAVQEATNGHEYEPRQNPATDYEVWTAIQEPRDWAALEKEWTQAADNLAKQKAAAN